MLLHFIAGGWLHGYWCGLWCRFWHCAQEWVPHAPEAWCVHWGGPSLFSLGRRKQLFFFLQSKGTSVGEPMEKYIFIIVEYKLRISIKRLICWGFLQMNKKHRSYHEQLGNHQPCPPALGGPLKGRGVYPSERERGHQCLQGHFRLTLPTQRRWSRFGLCLHRGKTV